MRKILLVLCSLLVLASSAAICYGDDHGRGHEGGRDWGERHDRHDHGGFGLYFGVPYYPYAPYPECQRVCRDRVVPVCNYDYWGDRWCHDEVVRDCRRVCY
ncbi:MAG TPA: hypothetical protein VK452_02620 [Dissulfurispiraceae bacterium]|nr:hypothetical protein [Dissulfurispiraceae bacterium]